MYKGGFLDDLNAKAILLPYMVRIHDHDSKPNSSNG